MQDPTFDQVTQDDSIINELGEVQQDVSQPRPRMPAPYSRRELRRMVAQFKRTTKPKRGHTKPLHDKEKRKLHNKMRKASRRVNRLHAEKMKARA